MTKSKLKVQNSQPKADRPLAEKLKNKTEEHVRKTPALEKKVDVESSDLKVKSLISDKKVSTRGASTMDELMGRKESTLSVPKRGSMIHGIITEVTGRNLLIDIGAKTEGTVSEKDFDEARDFIRSLKVGTEVTAYVVSPENDRGQILLSLRNAAGDWQWKQLQDWMRTGQVIEVRGLEVNKGGIVARIDSMDIQGFVPTSQLSSALAGNLDELTNRVFKAKIIEVDRLNNRLIFSERSVSEQGEISARKEALKGLKPGMKVKGKIVGLTDFGAFAKVKTGSPHGEAGGQEIEGLIHISELAWDKIDNASSAVKEGDDVDLLVLDVNPEMGKVGFSLKQLTPDPWGNIEERYPPGKKLQGVVCKVASFGDIIQLEPGVSGLLHISKIPTQHEPAVGDTIEVVVEDLDPEHRKLALGMAVAEVPAIYR